MPTQKSNSNSVRRFDRCIIHIGIEKTGTSAVQEYLRTNSSNLLKCGILYPTCAGVDRSSQWEFVAAIHDKPWTQDIGRALEINDKTAQTKFADALTAKLDQEANRSPDANTLVISSEHFHSRVSTPDMVERLKAYLSRWTDQFEIVVYFRRQDEVAVSFQSTRLKSGVQLTDEQLRGSALGPASYYSYDRLFANWCGAFGSFAMRPRLFEKDRLKGGDIVEDFCATAGLPKPKRRSTRINLSLDRKGFHFLQALNQVFPVTPGDQSDFERASLVKYISENYAGRYSPMNRVDAEKFYARYAPGNERLRQAAFPDYPQPLFHEDFSAYADKGDLDDRSYDEAVEIAFELWKAEQRQVRKQSMVRSLRDRLFNRK